MRLQRGLAFLSAFASSLAADQWPTDLYPEKCGLQEGCGCFARNALCARGVAFGFESLWWNAQNHGFSSGYEQLDDCESKILRVHSEWNPGFRVSLGRNTSYDRWEVSFAWTWYQNASHLFGLRGDLLIAGSENLGYFPSWVPEIGNTPYREVFSSWNLKHNCFDLELGRSFYITRALSLRPYGGVRGARLDQRFVNRFFNSSSGKKPFNMRASEDWWGVGPRFGLLADWHCGLGISVVGRAAGSLLFGEAEVMFSSGDCEASCKTYDSFNQLTPNLDLFLGLQWASALNGDRLFFSVGAGWETSYWWNQCGVPLFVNAAKAPLPTVGNQPVTMEGLTISLHLDF